MPRKTDTPQPQAIALPQIPEGAKFLLGLVWKWGSAKLLEWLNSKGLDLQAQAREAVRAEVLDQVRAEMAAAPKAEAPQA